MSYSREQWVRSFLAGLGNSNPSQNVVNWVINWTGQEGSDIGGQGDFNLLNTTQPMPGSHGGGSQGNIQYFTNFAQGVEANDIVIKNGLYPDLLKALQTNDEKSLGFGTSGPTSGVMHDLSIWCGGCNYGGWFAKQSPASNWLSQSFPGTVNTTVPTGSTTNTSLNPIDTGSILSALGLPSPEDVKNFFEQFMLVILGSIVFLIGILVVFFAGGKSNGESSVVAIPTNK